MYRRKHIGIERFGNDRAEDSGWSTIGASTLPFTNEASDRTPEPSQQRHQGLAKLVDKLVVRQFFESKLVRVVCYGPTIVLVAKPLDNFGEVTEIFLEWDVVDVRLKVPAIMTFKENLYRLGRSGFDNTAGNDTHGNRTGVVFKEPFDDFLIRSVGVILQVVIAALPRLIG